VPATTALPAPISATATVRRFFAAWAAGDVETMAELTDPWVVLAPIPGLLFTRHAYLGRAGVAEAVREIELRWDRAEMSVEDARVDGDEVVAHVRVAFEKHGMCSEGDLAIVCRLRDGRIVSLADDHPAAV